MFFEPFQSKFIPFQFVNRINHEKSILNLYDFGHTWDQGGVGANWSGTDTF